MKKSKRYCSSIILFIGVCVLMLNCGQPSTIETENLLNQMALNEIRNTDVIEKLSTTIKTRGNRIEELALLKKATSLIDLKEKLALTTTQLKSDPTYKIQATQTYIDTLILRFDVLGDDDKFKNVLEDAHLMIAEFENSSDKKDNYMHLLLQISYCETNLINRYGEEVGVQELYWDEEEIYEVPQFDLDSTATGLNFTPQPNYATTKQKANKLRENLAQAYKKGINPTQKAAVLDSAKHMFTNYLLNQIVPYWYNTTWEFDGYTALPQKGAIACGYFVSTTLKHMGVNVNRYKLAQQNPENESSTIAIDKENLKEYAFEELGKAIFTDLETYEDGLYFVGLDFHVGYLYIKNQQPYFIHSDYMDGFVRIEPAKASYAFESYKYFISPISNNPTFIKKWLLQEELVVKRG